MNKKLSQLRSKLNQTQQQIQTLLEESARTIAALARVALSTPAEMRQAQLPLHQRATPPNHRPLLPRTAKEANHHATPGANRKPQESD